jgi:hypothetical protein
MKNVFGKYGTYSLLLIIVLAAGVMCACNNSPGGTQNNPEVTPTVQNGVEVVYFHRSIRCSSCTYAEDTTRYAIETYFADELANGELVFISIDVQSEENASIVDKYGAYTSSLFMNKVVNGVEHIEEIITIWSAIGNDQAFVDLVKKEIEERL